MDKQNRVDLFNGWAGFYDDSVLSCHQFPFLGYREVIQEIVVISSARQGMRILELGIGTGRLSSLLSSSGCEIWGFDYSEKMLSIAQSRLPNAHLTKVDLSSDLPPDFGERFNRIVSAYVFHEFNLQKKVELLVGLSQFLIQESGYFVIGDISFPSAQDRAKANKLWQDQWDNDEYYWAADEAKKLLVEGGFNVEYTQISACGGVYRLFPPELSLKK